MFVQLQQFGLCPRSSQLRVCARCGQDRQISCYKLYYCACRNSRWEGAYRPQKIKPQTTWWAYPDSVVCKQVFDVGCDCSAYAEAELAARKAIEYVRPSSQFVFQPFAIELLGPLNDSAVSESAWKISALSGVCTETSFLLFSAVIQDFSTILFHDNFCTAE